jgi:hypothetical protein
MLTLTSPDGDIQRVYPIHILDGECTIPDDLVQSTNDATRRVVTGIIATLKTGSDHVAGIKWGEAPPAE